jgi:16S rRNA (cytosine1402-N4)-methyltransferase
MEVLKSFLNQSVQVLNTEGRLVLLTYHSLEDRMAKNFLKSGNIEGKIEKDFYGNVISPLRLINNKVIVATEEEVQNNPRSRSAKLRIATLK